MAPARPSHAALTRSLVLSAITAATFVMLRIVCAERALWLVCWPGPPLELWLALTGALFATERIACAVGRRRSLEVNRDEPFACLMFAFATAVIVVVLMPDFDVDALAWTTDRWHVTTSLVAVVAVIAAPVCAIFRLRYPRLTRTLLLTTAEALVLLAAWAAGLTMSGHAWLRPGQLAYGIVAVPAWAALISYRAGAPEAAHVVVRPLAAAAAMLVAVLVGIASHGGAIPPTPNHPNVFLITVDTLRADSTRDVPNLGRLAADGIVFDAAYAHAPWTQSSFASLMTSRYPSMVGFGRAAIEPFGHMTNGIVDPAAPTMASTLANDGYATVAVLTNSLLTSRYGFDRDFRRVSHVSQGYGYRGLALCATTLIAHRVADRYWLPNQATAMTELALRELDHLHADGPVFGWIHYIDPHGPYAAPGSPLHFSTEQLEVHRHARPDEQRAAAIREAYENEVRYVDAWIGRLLDGLRARALYDDALIVMTADHGEEFWEHGSVGHGNALHEEQLHVPLIVKLPRRELAGTRRATPVGLVDVLPTVLAVAGVPAPPGMMGRPLVAPSDPVEAERPVFSEALMGDTHDNVYEQKSIRTSTHTIIQTPALGLRQVYDRRTDLFEQHPSADVGCCPELASRLDAWTANMLALVTRDERPGTSIEDQRRRQLKALGYVD